MKYIEDIDIDNKRVILRADLNVTIKDGIILDDTKIKKSLKTINYLLEHNAHILIMSHLGKIKSEEDKKANSLKPIGELLKKYIKKDIYFEEDLRNPNLKQILDNNEVVLLENTRYEDYPLKLESGCDQELSKFWSSVGEVFINDAFGTSHRRHASNYGIAQYLPSAYGYLVSEELEGVYPVIDNIKRPFVVIMGGAKVDDKVALIENILEECDYLLVGGGIANTFLKAKNYNIGSSLYSEDYVDKIRELIIKFPKKIIIPEDVVVSNNKEVLEESVLNVSSDAIIYDIGPKTIDNYRQYLVIAKTIFVNGTMGLYEQEEFKKGTVAIYDILNSCNAKRIAGGGDAVASIKNLGYEKSFDYLSTGGGATLEYIASKKVCCFGEEQ